MARFVLRHTLRIDLPTHTDGVKDTSRLCISEGPQGLKLQLETPYLSADELRETLLCWASHLEDLPEVDRLCDLRPWTARLPESVQAWAECQEFVIP